MGYTLHITRKQNWYDEATEDTITLQEWLAYVAGDPEMHLSNHAKTTTTQNEYIEMFAEGLAVWKAFSRQGQYGEAWFHYSNGDIDVKNPDLEIIGKMLLVADALGAKVQGDDGEIYNTEYIRFRTAEAGKKSKKWWQLW